MAEKNILMQRKTATGYDSYYPKTKVENVAGAAKQADLDAHLADMTQHGIAWKKICETVTNASTLEIEVGVSGYKEYRLVCKNIMCPATNGAKVYMRLNNLTTEKYNTKMLAGGTSITIRENKDSFEVGRILNNTSRAFIDLQIQNYDLSAVGLMSHIVDDGNSIGSMVWSLGGFAQSIAVNTVTFFLVDSGFATPTTFNSGAIFEVWGR